MCNGGCIKRAGLIIVVAGPSLILLGIAPLPIVGCNDIGSVNLSLWHVALAGVYRLRGWDF